MKEHKRYIERNDLKNGNHLEIGVFYTKGGMSYFTGQVSPRGYYLSVRPVTLERGMVSFNLLAGCKKLVLDGNRYSDKQFIRAVEIAKAYEDELIATVMKIEAA